MSEKTETISKRKEAGRNYTYNQLNKFKCEGCRGRAIVDDGRVKVLHKMGCKVWLQLLTHPRFLETLDKYRYTN